MCLPIWKKSTLFCIERDRYFLDEDKSRAPFSNVKSTENAIYFWCWRDSEKMKRICNLLCDSIAMCIWNQIETFHRYIQAYWQKNTHIALFPGWRYTYIRNRCHCKINSQYFCISSYINPFIETYWAGSLSHPEKIYKTSTNNYFSVREIMDTIFCRRFGGLDSGWIHIKYIVHNIHANIVRCWMFNGCWFYTVNNASKGLINWKWFACKWSIDVFYFCYNIEMDRFSVFQCEMGL